MGKIYLVTVGRYGTLDYRVVAACTDPKEAHKFQKRFLGHIEVRDDGVCRNIPVFRVMFHKVEGGFEYESCSERFQEDSYAFSHLNRPWEFGDCWAVVVEAEDRQAAQRVAHDVLTRHLMGE